MVGGEDCGGEEEGLSSPLQTCKGTNINLATVSNLLRKCSLKGRLAQHPAPLYSESMEMYSALPELSDI